MIKHEQNTGRLSQNLHPSIYFRQWNQMEQLHCFNVWKTIGISSMGLTSVMGDRKAYSSVKNNMPYGSLIYRNKEECRTHIRKRMGTVLPTIVKNYKGMSCISIS